MQALTSSRMQRGGPHGRFSNKWVAATSGNLADTRPASEDPLPRLLNPSFFTGNYSDKPLLDKPFRVSKRETIRMC